MHITVKIIIAAIVFLGVFIAIVFGAERSGKWEKVRLEHLRLESICQWCGNDNIKEQKVHHILQFSEYGKYELLDENLITMCHSCQLIVGHNRNFQSYNPFVREECEMHQRLRAKYPEKIRQLKKAYDK
jgi:hypothetical protein